MGRYSLKSKTTGTQKAIEQIAKALADVFKKQQRQTRERAWKKLQTGEGKRAVDQLLNNPNRPLNQFPKLAFKEWLDNDSG